MVKINIIITTLYNTKIDDERNMRYYWLITVSHYLFFSYERCCVLYFHDGVSHS